MSIKTFIDALGRGLASPAYLPQAEDSYLLREALLAIKRSIPEGERDFLLTAFDLDSPEQTAPVEQIVDVLNTVSFMGGRKTVAVEGVQKLKKMEDTKEDIKKDIDYLVRLWEDIQMRKDKISSPQLLYSDLDITLRSVRDFLSHETDSLLIDSKEEYDKLVEFVNTFFPELVSKIKLYEGNEPIFDAYGIELEIPKALGKRVWLKSGGYIVLDQTEALTSIDVNTGKYVGKASLEDTIFKTNMEAVKEIAYQIRLRNLGGIIIIDFIDMEKEENRHKLFSVFQEAMCKDRAKCSILEVSELGLIQMTRKRVRESLERVLCEPCSYCDGKGFVKSPLTVCYEIFTELRRIARGKKNCKIMITANLQVADLIYDDEREGIERIERENGFKIIVKADKNYHQEFYEVATL